MSVRPKPKGSSFTLRSSTVGVIDVFCLFVGVSVDTTSVPAPPTGESGVFIIAGSTPRLTKVSLSFSSNNKPAAAAPANTSAGLLANVPGMLAITSASVPPCLYTFIAPCIIGPRTGTFTPTFVPAPTPV